MRKFLLFNFVLSFLIFSAYAQERTVTGKVTSAEDGSGLPGVNVVLKGTTTGTVTDIDGNYRVNVPSEGGILIFSFIGLAAQEVEIGSRSVVDVQMISDVTELTEVVVTAQGIAREEKSIGYSIATVEEDKLERKGETDVLRALSGKVAGVNIVASNGAPGSATRINIRGFTTTGDNQPLIIVDGVPFGNGTNVTVNPLTGGSNPGNRLNDLDPNNIASLSVLKGAAAAVLYGTRAANGVILITTKSGSSKSKGLRVSLTSSYNVEQIQQLPDYQNDFGQGANFTQNTTFFGSWGPSFESTPTQPAFFSGPEFAEAFPERQGRTDPFEAAPDNVEDFFETGFLVDNGVTVTGGNDKGSFYISYNRTDQEGIVPNSAFERNSFNIGGNTKFENGLSFGGTFSFVQSEQVGFVAGGGAAGATGVFSQLLFLPRNYDLQGLPNTNPIDGSNVFYRADVNDNPIWSADNNIFTSDVTRSFGNLNIGYEVNDWISASYKFGYNTFNLVSIDFTEISSGSRVNVFNREGGLDESTFNSEEFNSDFIINIRRKLSSDFGLTANIGQNINVRNSRRQDLQGQGLVNRGIRDLDNATTVLATGGGISTRRILGVFADLNFSYKDFAFINYQARADWSSTLPENSRGFFYNGVSGSFVFSEAFNIANRIFSYGKIRAGFGTNGRDPNVFATSQTFDANPTFGNNVGTVQLPFNNTGSTSIDNTLANNDLDPEFTTEFEIGTELKFLDGRVGIDFTYYNKNTEDLLINRTLPASSGFNVQFDNVGEITNEGIEVGLDLTPVRISGFDWNLYSVFTRNVSEVESLADGQTSLSIGFGFTGDFGAFLIPGEQFGVIQGTAYARDDVGNILINETTGLPIATAESEIIADPNPDFELGVTNTFSYKGLSLSVLVNWRQGGDFFSATTENLIGRGVLEQTADIDRRIPRVIDGVLGDPDSREPILDENGNTIQNNTLITSNQFYANGFQFTAQEGAVFDATTIELREISLDYRLPSKWFDNIPLGGANVSLIGRNLAFWAPNQPRGAAINPNGGGQLGNVNGFDFAFIPNVRRYGITVKVDF